MTEEDFTNAGAGIAKVLTTMATAIWDTYNPNKDKLFGDDFKDILENIKVLSVAEGEILSTLSEGLQSYTQLLIPVKWNNRGKAIAFRQMTDTDFINAGKNIGAVMVTMASAIHSAWTGGDFTVITAGGTLRYKGTGKGFMNYNLHPAGKTGTSESFLDTNNDGKIDTKTITLTMAGFFPYGELWIIVNSLTIQM